jgi:Tfp pilus assembly PilM family ATPase
MMARGSRSILGIELQERLIRIVEVSDGSNPVVLAVGESAMPERALQNGLIVKSDLIATAIRNLLDSLNISSTDAVFGVAPSSGVMRTLSVPPVPDAELGPIIAGEVKHYRLLNTDGAAYNYFPLRASKGEGVGDSLNVLLVGVEAPVVGGIRDIALKSGLSVSALEPSHIAMYRSVQESIAGPTTMALLVGEGQTAIVMHSQGQISLFREIDIGSNALVLRHVGEDPFAKGGKGASSEASETLDPEVIHLGPANTLAIEVKRSIEYFQREHKGEEPIDRLLVATTELGLQAMLPWLGAEVGVPTQLVSHYSAPSDRDAIKAQLMPPNGAKFSAAYGLAVRGAYSNKKNVPCMDLFVHERTAVQQEVKRKGVAGSLLAAICALAMGIGIAYYFGIEANHVEHRLEHLTEDLNDLKQKSKQTSEEQTIMLKQYDLLRQGGVPLSKLIHSVSTTVPNMVGLTDIETDNTGKVIISGEALDENSAIRFADALKRLTILTNAGVSSIEKVDPDGLRDGFKFKITSQGIFGKPPTPGANS